MVSGAVWGKKVVGFVRGGGGRFFGGIDSAVSECVGTWG